MKYLFFVLILIGCVGFAQAESPAASGVVEGTTMILDGNDEYIHRVIGHAIIGRVKIKHLHYPPVVRYVKGENRWGQPDSLKVYEKPDSVLYWPFGIAAYFRSETYSYGTRWGWSLNCSDRQYSEAGIGIGYRPPLLNLEAAATIGFETDEEPGRLASQVKFELMDLWFQGIYSNGGSGAWYYFESLYRAERPGKFGFSGGVHHERNLGTEPKLALFYKAVEGQWGMYVDRHPDHRIQITWMATLRFDLSKLHLGLPEE